MLLGEDLAWGAGNAGDEERSEKRAVFVVDRSVWGGDCAEEGI